MKKVEDFMSEEREIMREIYEVLKRRGYEDNELRVFDNWLGEPTVAMDIEDEDGYIDTYFLCFGVAEQMKMRAEEKNYHE